MKLSLCNTCLFHFAFIYIASHLNKKFHARKMSNYGLDSRGSNPDREFGISIFITKFKVVVRPGAVSLGIRQPDHKVDNSS